MKLPNNAHAHRALKVKFYQKFDFESVGEVFASSMTGVPHIKMQKEMM
jgi:predicted GNAT family N-acyltransferase